MRIQIFYFLYTITLSFNLLIPVYILFKMIYFYKSVVTGRIRIQWKKEWIRIRRGKNQRIRIIFNPWNRIPKHQNQRNIDLYILFFQTLASFKTKTNIFKDPGPHFFKCRIRIRIFHYIKKRCGSTTLQCGDFWLTLVHSNFGAWKLDFVRLVLKNLAW